MALVVAPLGVGLGAVAPTIVKVFFDARWTGMASILMVLSVMTVFQPVAWSAVAYLAAEKMTRPIMVMSIARAVLLLALVAVLGWLGGPVWACAGVGAGYAVHSVATVIVTARSTSLSVRSILRERSAAAFRLRPDVRCRRCASDRSSPNGTFPRLCL